MSTYDKYDMYEEDFDNDDQAREPVTVEADAIVAQTDKGILLRIKDRDKWFPKSEVQVDRRGLRLFVTMPEWLYAEKNLR